MNKHGLVRLTLFLLVSCITLSLFSSCSSENLDRIFGKSSNSNREINQTRIGYCIYKISIFDTDGLPLIYINSEFPFLINENNDSAIDKINQDIFSLNDEYISEIGKTGLRYAKEDKKSAMSSGYDFSCHSYSRVSHIKYNGNSYFSVYHERTEDTGGARPNLFYDAYSYDVEKGVRLKLTDFLGPDAVKAVYTTVRRKITMTKGSKNFIYYDSYRKDAKNLYSGNDYYLSPSGLTVFYQPSTIAPFSAGAPSFSISYRDIRMRRYVPRLPENSMAVTLDEVYSDAIGQIDQNRALFSEKHTGIDWSKYSFEVTDITERTAKLILYSGPVGGKLQTVGENSVTAKMTKGEDGWYIESVD